MRKYGIWCPKSLVPRIAYGPEKIWFLEFIESTGLNEKKPTNPINSTNSTNPINPIDPTTP
jgi:hypothetical protein